MFLRLEETRNRIRVGYLMEGEKRQRKRNRRNGWTLNGVSVSRNRRVTTARMPIKGELFLVNSEIKKVRVLNLP